MEGSVDIVGGFNVVASADASLFGLLDVSKSITLFSKKFNLFQVSRRMQRCCTSHELNITFLTLRIASELRFRLGGRAVHL